MQKTALREEVSPWTGTQHSRYLAQHDDAIVENTVTAWQLPATQSCFCSRDWPRRNGFSLDDPGELPESRRLDGQRRFGKLQPACLHMSLLYYRPIVDRRCIDRSCRAFAPSDRRHHEPFADQPSLLDQFGPHYHCWSSCGLGDHR